MKTLYISDLDGTILQKNEAFSPYSLQTINSLIKAGLSFSYATARSEHSASIVTKGLELKLPAVLHNGVYIIDFASGKRILHNSFSHGEIKAVSDFLDSRSIYPLVYSFIDGKERKTYLRGQEKGKFKNHLGMRKADPRLREAQNSEELYEGEVFYFTCIGEEAELSPVFDQFKNNDSYNTVFQYDLYFPEYWCELMPKKATKANGILQLKELYGFEKIVCFGDGVNDIPMFEIADECYAVSNAVPELKKIATAVIESNTDDGVAKWLKNHAGF